MSDPKRKPPAPIFGACYSFCKTGDTIAILYGSWPVALRRDYQNTAQWKILGEVDLNGFMHGEALNMFEEREFEISGLDFEYLHSDFDILRVNFSKERKELSLDLLLVDPAVRIPLLLVNQISVPHADT